MPDLYDQAPDDAEEVIIAWLKPLGRTAINRKTNDPLPFRVVRRVAGDEDEIQFSDNPVVSVHTFGASEQQTKDETRLTHRRMLLLARNPLEDIVLPGGRIANVEYLNVFESPTWSDYGDDNIFRKVARYQFGLSFVAV